MKKRLLVIGLLLVAMGAACAVLTFKAWRLTSREWTTRSPKALKELKYGLENLEKRYRMDAVRHFEEALELDPGFAMAKLNLATLYVSPSERRRMTRGLREVDPEDLNPRERFLVAYHLAREDGRSEAAAKLVSSFLAEHPGDPFAIRIQCRQDWDAQRWDAAEACYSNLLELHPNLVEAHNNLGYMAMARGRFEEADERFQTYRFVAPDQATPHYSLAVLLTLRGRYSEAEAALDKVIEIKPDFCLAYPQRAEIGLLSARFELIEQALGDLSGYEMCRFVAEQGFDCAMRAWRHYLDGDPEEAWRQVEGTCLKKLDGFDLLAHRVALMTGRSRRAAEIEAVLERYRADVRASKRPVHAQFLDALAAHLEGVRALVSDELELAADRFTVADESLEYWGGERSSIKLFNRLNLLRVLEMSGQVKRAAELRSEIDAVNPLLVESFALPGIDALSASGFSRTPSVLPMREDRHQ